MNKTRLEKQVLALHLQSMEVIAQTFGVKTGTVKGWRDKGAPILRIGKRFQASYFDLWEWLKRQEAIDSREEKG